MSDWNLTIQKVFREERARAKERKKILHPGDVIRQKLKEYGITQNALAMRIRVPANRINSIVKRDRGVSAETALRLGIVFGTSPEYWLNLQAMWELSEVKHLYGAKIDKEVQPL